VRRGDLTVLVLFSAAVGACAHKQPDKADPYVASGVASIDAWFETLPQCPPLAEKKLTMYSPDATFVEVHGPLTLTSTPECVVTRCEGECCNTCTPAWVVVPDWSDGPTRELAVQRSRDARPMSASVKECKVSSVRERIRKPNVIVTGWLESDPVQPKIIRASICVVKPPPPPPGQAGPEAAAAPK
jgi:hypothetical protein